MPAKKIGYSIFRSSQRLVCSTLLLIALCSWDSWVVALQLGIEEIADGIAEKVRRQHHQEDRQSGENDDPRRHQRKRRGGAGHHQAPRGLGLLNAGTEIIERRLLHDRQTEIGGG